MVEWPKPHLLEIVVGKAIMNCGGAIFNVILKKRCNYFEVIH